MDRCGFVTLFVFVSEGAGLDTIVAEREAAGETVKRDAFGHVKIDTINVGNWFQKHFATLLGAERSMVQKSGYYARSAPANYEDLRLIQSMVDLGVESALNGVSGVTGHDEDQNGKLRTIEFPRIKGEALHFDFCRVGSRTSWTSLDSPTGQPDQDYDSAAMISGMGSHEVGEDLR